MSTENEVRKASEQFYAALNTLVKGDASQMAGIWSRSAAVTTHHPTGGREVGWDAVRGAWDQFASLASGGLVNLTEQAIQVAGDMAYELGTEKGQATLAGEELAIEHRVTNIYRREAGAWKIVHHHTDISPDMLDFFKRLKNGA
jgi:ketosteroid isomerase-like protein